MNIAILVEDRSSLKRVDRLKPITGGKKHLTIQFVFPFSGQIPNEYDQCQAIFWYDSLAYTIVEIDKVTGKAEVPEQFLKMKSFKISLRTAIWEAENLDEVYSYRISIDLISSGFENDSIIGNPPIEPGILMRIEALEKAVDELTKQPETPPEETDSNPINPSVDNSIIKIPSPYAYSTRSITSLGIGLNKIGVAVKCSDYIVALTGEMSAGVHAIVPNTTINLTPVDPPKIFNNEVSENLIAYHIPIEDTIVYGLQCTDMNGKLLCLGFMLFDEDGCTLKAIV